MEPYELYVSPIPQRKKFVPFNKGKKWDDYLDKEAQQKILKNLKRTGRPDIRGWNKKPIIAHLNGQIIGFYSSSFEAEKKLGILARNIRKCCNGERKTAGGIVWKFDTIKMKLQKKEK